MRSATITTLLPGFRRHWSGHVAPRTSATRTAVPLSARGIPRGHESTALASRGSRKGALAAILLVLGTFAPAMAADLVAKRAACAEVARDRVTARGRAGSEVYRVLVERRRAFVQKCMEEKAP